MLAQAITEVGFGVEVVEHAVVAETLQAVQRTRARLPEDAPAFFRQAFTEARADGRPMVIDFWAKWCGPCKSFSQVVETVAKDHADVVFAAVDIDAQPELAKEFQIRTVPSIMVLRNRVMVFAGSGAMPVSALNDLIAQAKSLDMQQLQQQLDENEKGE